MAKKPTKSPASGNSKPRTTKTPKAAQQPAAKAETKQATVLALLRRQNGASVPEIVDATGWQQHSVRGFFAGALKKRLGIEVISEKGEDGVRRYYVAPLAS